MCSVRFRARLNRMFFQAVPGISSERLRFGYKKLFFWCCSFLKIIKKFCLTSFRTRTSRSLLLLLNVLFRKNNCSLLTIQKSQSEQREFESYPRIAQIGLRACLWNEEEHERIWFLLPDWRLCLLLIELFYFRIFNLTNLPIKILEPRGLKLTKRRENFYRRAYVLGNMCLCYRHKLMTHLIPSILPPASSFTIKFFQKKCKRKP